MGTREWYVVKHSISNFSGISWIIVVKIFEFLSGKHPYLCLRPFRVISGTMVTILFVRLRHPCFVFLLIYSPAFWIFKQKLVSRRLDVDRFHIHKLMSSYPLFVELLGDGLWIWYQLASLMSIHIRTVKLVSAASLLSTCSIKEQK
jgi:hypothetical protein